MSQIRVVIGFKRILLLFYLDFYNTKMSISKKTLLSEIFMLYSDRGFGGTCEFDYASVLAV
jgi:hypothetical protein